MACVTSGLSGGICIYNHECPWMRRAADAEAEQMLAKLREKDEVSGIIREGYVYDIYMTNLK